MKEVEREILLAFWKVHILHHAAEGSVYGQWMLNELRRHGYDLSPGTLYPILRRMEAHGWLYSHKDEATGPRGRIDYHITRLGLDVLDQLRRQIVELLAEVAGESKHKSKKP